MQDRPDQDVVEEPEVEEAPEADRQSDTAREAPEPEPTSVQQDHA